MSASKIDGKLILKPGERPRTVIAWDNIDGCADVTVELSPSPDAATLMIVTWRAERDVYQQQVFRQQPRDGKGARYCDPAYDE